MASPVARNSCPKNIRETRAAAYRSPAHPLPRPERKRRTRRAGIISEPNALNPEPCSLCVLFAGVQKRLSLSRQSALLHIARTPGAGQSGMPQRHAGQSGSAGLCGLAFAGFPTFWPMTFHLLASYSLMAASSAALCFCFVSMCTVPNTSIAQSVSRDPPRLPRTRHSACPVAVVVSGEQHRTASGDDLPCTSASLLSPLFAVGTPGAREQSAYRLPRCAVGRGLHVLRRPCCRGVACFSLPLRSRSSSFVRLSSASASAPRPPSTACWSGSSWPWAPERAHHRRRQRRRPWRQPWHCLQNQQAWWRRLPSGPPSY